MKQGERTDARREKKHEMNRGVERARDYEESGQNGQNGALLSIMELREIIISTFKRYETPLVYAGKFLFGMMVFSSIGGYFTKLAESGNAVRLGGFAMLLLLSLITAIVPPGWFFALIWLFITLNTFFVSLELSVIAGAFLLCIILFYISMFPKESYLIILLMLCFKLKIPYFAVMFAGMFAGLQAVGAIIVGTLLWSVARSLPESGISDIAGNTLANLNLLSLPDNFAAVLESAIHMLSDNNSWIQVSLIFAVSFVIIRIVSKLPIPYSMEAGLLSGTLSLILGSLIGLSASVDVGGGTLGGIGVIFSVIFSILPAYICKFFHIIVDYNRAESVSFQDDEYLYYVKAVPKVKYKI